MRYNYEAHIYRYRNDRPGAFRHARKARNPFKDVEAMNAILEGHTVNTIDLVRIVGSFEETDRMVDFGYILHDDRYRWHVTTGGLKAMGVKR